MAVTTHRLGTAVTTHLPDTAATTHPEATPQVATIHPEATHLVATIHPATTHRVATIHQATTRRVATTPPTLRATASAMFPARDTIPPTAVVTTLADLPPVNPKP
jgi:hypothetical protein